MPMVLNTKKFAFALALIGLAVGVYVFVDGRSGTLAQRQAERASIQLCVNDGGQWIKGECFAPAK